MSLHEACMAGAGRHGSRSGIARFGLAFCLCAAALAGGCSDGSGFRPMYAASSNGEHLEGKLASVDVATIGGKTGQRLRNDPLAQLRRDRLRSLLLVHPILLRKTRRSGSEADAENAYPSILKPSSPLGKAIRSLIA